LYQRGGGVDSANLNVIELPAHLIKQVILGLVQLLPGLGGHLQINGGICADLIRVIDGSHLAVGIANISQRSLKE
jgi:hypothetical protein